MSQPNLLLEITPENEIIRIARGRKTVLANISKDNKTLTWVDQQTQANFHKSVEAFLSSENIAVETELMAGQKPDVVPDNAPPMPKMHKMQGDLTPSFLEWEMKWKPISFQNRMGVVLRDLKEGEKAPNDPRDLWMRAKVIRTDKRPDPDAQGGQYIATKYTRENQIIARRASHITYTVQEVYRGDSAVEQAEPFEDPLHPENLHKLAKRDGGKEQVEIIAVTNATATSGSPI